MDTTPIRKIERHESIDFRLISNESELSKLLHSSKYGFVPFGEKNAIINDYRRYVRYNRLKDLQLAKLEKELSHSSSTPISKKVTFLNGIIRYGEITHVFREEELEKMFRFLWRRKSVVSQNKAIINEPKPVTRKAIETETGISPGRLKTSVDSVNGTLMRKKIPVRIKMPSSVYVEVTQEQE